MSIICVGDLYQLKPVQGGWIFQDRTNAASSLSVNLWKEYFSMFELTDIMRQRDDGDFALLLNRLRTNEMTIDDREVLRRHEVKSSDAHYRKNAPHLFLENYFIHMFNDSIITSMNTEKVTVSSIDSVIAPSCLSRDARTAALNNIKSVDHNTTGGLHTNVTIVTDMIYDFTANIDTEDGLANGASCVIKYIEYKQLPATDRPSIIWVRFLDDRCGRDTRTKYKHLYHDGIEGDWTPVFSAKRTFTYSRKTYERVQFPLQPAAARSVHRAQGSTLEEVVIDLSQQKRTRKVAHMHYVALSRVKSLDGLQILNFNDAALHMDSNVTGEMKRLRETALLQTESIQAIDPNEHFLIAFNNCRSLHKYHEDIKSDHNLKSVNVLGLAETKLLKTERDRKYAIDGFNLERNDQTEGYSGPRPPHGLAVYTQHSNVSEKYSFSSEKIEFTFMQIQHGLLDLQVVFLYKAPRLSDQLLIDNINDHLLPKLDVSKPLVVMGDFNINVLNQKNYRVLLRLKELFSCELLTDYITTEHMSSLDLIFSNLTSEIVHKTGVCNAYWSDHFLIYISLYSNGCV